MSTTDVSQSEQCLKRCTAKVNADADHCQEIFASCENITNCL